MGNLDLTLSKICTHHKMFALTCFLALASAGMMPSNIDSLGHIPHALRILEDDPQNPYDDSLVRKNSSDDVLVFQNKHDVLLHSLLREFADCNIRSTQLMDKIELIPEEQLFDAARYFHHYLTQMGNPIEMHKVTCMEFHVAEKHKYAPMDLFQFYTDREAISFDQYIQTFNYFKTLVGDSEEADDLTMHRLAKQYTAEEHGEL